MSLLRALGSEVQRPKATGLRTEGSSGLPSGALPSPRHRLRCGCTGHASQAMRSHSLLPHRPATSGAACILRQLSECFLQKESFFVAVSPPGGPGLNHEAVGEERQPQPKAVARGAETSVWQPGSCARFASKKREKSGSAPRSHRHHAPGGLIERERKQVKERL